MKVAAAAYPLDQLSSWTQYEDKIALWVSEAARNEAQVLVFPEYGAMELATLAGPEAASNLEASIHAVSEQMKAAQDLHRRLAQEYNVYILGASAPVYANGPRPVNRAQFYAPTGESVFQDKQIMTRFERERWNIHSGGQLQLIETPLATFGILICYDSEFPLLGRALSACDVILVPSCTDALSGYWRVRIGAMARALEQQCVTVMSSTVGDAPWSPAVDENVGAGGIFCPPDIGFPATGVIAEGALNTPAWTYAEVDLSQIAKVRTDGAVLNQNHWPEQNQRIAGITKCQIG